MEHLKLRSNIVFLDLNNLYIMALPTFQFDLSKAIQRPSVVTNPYARELPILHGSLNYTQSSNTKAETHTKCKES